MNSKKDLSKNFQVLNTIFETNHVVFEPINPSSLSDAQLILDLRSRESNNFLRNSSGDINSQIEYLKTYHERNKHNYEIYYKLKDKIKDDAFCIHKVFLNNTEDAFEQLWLILAPYKFPLID